MPANRAELQEQITLARELGDEDAELEALELLDAMPADPGPQSVMDYAGGMAGAINQGLTLGMADELAGGMAAINPMQMGEGYFTGMPERYVQGREGARTLESQFERENPKSAMVGETIGALATGAAAAPRLAAAEALPIFSRAGLLQSAKVGGLEGAAYGYGVGEGGVVDTAQSMVEMGTGGALLGPALETGIGGVAALGGAIKRKLSTTPEDKARTLVSKIFEYEDLDPYQAGEALEQLGPQGILADIGPNLQAATDVIASDVGPARKRASAILESRQMGQQGRIMEAAEGALDVGAGEFMGTVKQMSQQRFERSQPLYQEAFDTPVEITEEMAKLFERPSVKKAMGKVKNIAQEEGIDIGDLDWENPTTKQLDTLKKALDKQIGIKRRAGDPDAGRITRTKNELLNIIDEQNPAYKQARNTWESDTKTMEAADLGRRVLKDDAEETAELIAKMSDTEKEAYTMGAIKAVEDAVQGSADTHNAMRRIVGNPKLRNRLQNAFPDKASFDEFMSVMDREATFAATRAGVGKGSQTDIRSQARKTMGMASEGQGILSMAGDTMRQNYGTAATKAVDKLMKTGTINPEVGAELGNILLGNILLKQGMPKEEVAQLLQKQFQQSTAGMLSTMTGAMVPGILAQ